MAVALVSGDRQDRLVDPLCARLDGMLAELAEAVAGCAELRDVGEVSDGERIDRIARLEQLKAAVAALQAAESVRFAESQVEQQLPPGCTRECRPRDRGSDRVGLPGVADQGSRRLGLPGRCGLICRRPSGCSLSGRVSEYVASLVVSETRHLPAPSVGKSTRRLSTPGSPGWVRGGRRPVPAGMPTRRPARLSQRGRTERRHRRVGLRPAPDTMAILSGYLPVEQGVACLAALRRHTDTVKADGDRRSRDQIMADTLVERVTDRPAAADVNIEVHLLMPLSSLLNPHDATPAEMAGYGPIPAPASPGTSSTQPGPGCGGGGCSPPRPAARWWVGIGSAAASTAGWPS